MHTHHWRYLHGKPSSSAKIKVDAADFKVVEQLGFAPSGEGEHIYLWVQKQGLNTAFVAEQLAKFCQLPLRAVTYAGRKDKYALTEQWFGVHAPGNIDYAWQNLSVPGLKVLKVKRHNKKLRTGVLKGNRFELVLRDLSSSQHLSQRIEAVATRGVPNYFGQQRFGDSRYHAQGGNLALAEKMLQGETIRNRNKRALAISALRAWLFNQFVSARLAQGCFDLPLSGDVCVLAGSNSFFVAHAIDETIRQRLRDRDILLSAPMWGAGSLVSTQEALVFEQTLAGEYASACELLASLGLKQERRTIRLYPQNLQWKIDQQNLTISFDLPAGAFATSVVREIVTLDVPGANQ